MIAELVNYISQDITAVTYFVQGIGDHIASITSQPKYGLPVVLAALTLYNDA